MKIGTLSYLNPMKLLLLAVFVSGACCYDDMTVQDLRPDTAAELEYIVETPWVDLKANCTGHPVQRTAEFLLYNRNNPTKPIILNGNNMGQINPNKDVIMIIHGWLSSARSSGTFKLRDAYLKRYDCNLISVNWTKPEYQPYTKAYCDVPGIGLAVSKLLCTVSRQLDIPLSTIHIVGHSIGAQIAGFAGQYAPLQCDQKIGRITALDPAGPLFQYLQENQKLDPEDAMFVDVIHTDIDSTGSERKCGSADFYPNCAILQPGCPEIKDVVNETLVSDAICSSLRSIEYMAESVNSNLFIAISCGQCPAGCRPDIVQHYTVMGEECRRVGDFKLYTIPTKSSPPYGQGWAPYP